MTSTGQPEIARACDPCLRRGYLVASLAPHIAGLLDRPRPSAKGLLALPEAQLLAAVGGERAEPAAAALDELDLGSERERLASSAVIAVCRHAPAYPEVLRDLDDAPAVLFGCGRIEALELLAEEPAVAIVGTRNPSAYGREVAYALGRGLAVAGVPVVSGLALGIDARAHRGCLDGAGVPLAVLACGPDFVYPRRHRRLYEELRGAGLVLSEFPPGVRPFRWSFPARNRIMAGLARMTVVVEAADPSGSLITGEFARDLGRSVAAVPGPITSRVARGTNGLLRDGATPVTGTEDILDELFGVGGRRVEPEAKPRDPGDPILARVLEAAEGTGSIGAIAKAAGIDTARTRAAIARLEADGYLVRDGLAGWQRAAGPILADP